MLILLNSFNCMIKFSILVADDDDDDYYLLEMAFRELDILHHLHRVRDGAELITYLSAAVNKQQDLPDLVLLDINMPKLNGIEALERIKKDKSCVDVPVVMYSTCNNDEQKMQCMELGARDFITKGSSFDKILSTMRNIDHYIRHSPDITQPVTKSKQNKKQKI